MLKTRRPKLLVAVALLLLSATLLTTASYAWFAMNTKASANNFEVEAYTDSLYLQISKTNDDNAFNGNDGSGNNGSTSISYADAERENIRLVTFKRIDSATLLYKAPAFTAVADDRYFGEATDENTYYTKADSDIGGTTDPNYIKVTPYEGTSLKDLYTDITFELVTTNSKATAGVTYYEKVNNNYTPVTTDADTIVKGYYTISQLQDQDSYALTEDATFAEGKTYYTESEGSYTAATVTSGANVDAGTYYEKTTTNGSVAITATTPLVALGEDDVYTTSNASKQYWELVSGAFHFVDDLKLGMNMLGYFTTTLTAVDKTANEGKFEDAVYYVAQGDDLICIGNPGAGTAIENYLYWGRAYSTELDEVQENNTLNVLSADQANADYYMTQTFYLRQGEKTNHAENLRVSKVDVSGAYSGMKDALRVLFVATSTSGESVSFHYDAGTNKFYNYGEAEAEGSQDYKMFDTLLGDEQETITVQVYIFFDGTDAVAKNTQLAILNGQIVSIEFSIDEINYNA